MTITLSANSTTVALDADFFWSDEYDWSATEQTVTRSVTGALLVHAGARNAGRPITLMPEDDAAAWMTRADMVQLQAWADAPGQVMTLTLRGTAHRVLFRHHDGGAFEATPLVHYADPAPEDWLLATLRFITIPE